MSGHARYVPVAFETPNETSLRNRIIASIANIRRNCFEPSISRSPEIVQEESENEFEIERPIGDEESDSECSVISVNNEDNDVIPPLNTNSESASTSSRLSRLRRVELNEPIDFGDHRSRSPEWIDDADRGNPNGQSVELETRSRTPSLPLSYLTQHRDIHGTDDVNMYNNLDPEEWHPNPSHLPPDNSNEDPTSRLDTSTVEMAADSSGLLPDLVDRSSSVSVMSMDSEDYDSDSISDSDPADQVVMVPSLG